MKIPELTKFSKDLLVKINQKQVKFDSKDMPKIEAYLQMIIARGEIIIKDTMRMQRFMEDIEDGVEQLKKRNVVVPDIIMGIVKGKEGKE